MGLVKFALLGIDLLGWPLISLVYPLFASIRAVETGSRKHMRKLVIYWTLFSLFSLFEFVFVKIIEWMPFWSGVRLVVSFCLVMPQFEGSCLAYQGLVCLVIDRFGMLKGERLCKRDTFLDLVEKYIKENGSEALEKLIALEMTPPEARFENRHPETSPLKNSQQEWTCDLCKVTIAGESTLNAHLQGSKHKSEVEFLKASLLGAEDTGPSPSVQHTQSASAAWEPKGAYAAAGFKERMSAKETAEKRCPETPLFKKAEQELTCDLCKVTTASKSMLNAHLQGSKHKSKLESPKASLLDSKDTRPSPLVQQAPSVSAAWDLNTKHAAAEDKEIIPSKEIADKICPETLLLKAQKEWTCDLCKVTTVSESVLNDHLQGSEHKSKVEANLKASLLDAKDTGPPPSVQHVWSVSTAWDLKGTYPAADDKEIMPPKGTAEDRCPETPLFKKAQQQWTCDLGKVTATSEITLNRHLQGSKHKAKLETTLKESLHDAKDIGPSPLVQQAQSVSAALDLNSKHVAAEDKEIITPKEIAEKKCPETPLLKKAQQELTCDLCKFTTESESTLNDHLQGSKHKSRLETTLEASLLEAKDTGPSPSVQQVQSVSAAWHLKGTYPAADDTEIMPPKGTAEDRRPETPLLKKAQQQWTCDLCKLTTKSEIMLNSHLQGSKHKAKLETTLKESLHDAKDTGPSPLVQQAQSVSAAWDLNGKHVAAEDKDIIPPKEIAEKKCPETPLLKKAQQEWTCDLWESILNDHLQGSKHKSRLETTLDASLLEAKDTGPLPSVQQVQSVSAAWDLKGLYPAAEDKEIMTPKGTAEDRRPETPLPKNTGANAEVKGTKTPPEASRAETPPPKKEWSCGLCKVKATSEKNLNAHLLGGKHKSNFESLKRWKGKLVVLEINGVFKHWCIICDAKLISDFDLASHIKGKRHASKIEEMEKH